MWIEHILYLLIIKEDEVDVTIEEIHLLYQGGLGWGVVVGHHIAR